MTGHAPVGIGAELSENKIISRLLELDLQRAAEEEQGQVGELANIECSSSGVIWQFPFAKKKTTPF